MPLDRDNASNESRADTSPRYPSFPFPGCRKPNNAKSCPETELRDIAKQINSNVSVAKSPQITPNKNDPVVAWALLMGMLRPSKIDMICLAKLL